MDLKLVCCPWSHRSCAELTGIWPPLPIVITNVFDTVFPKDHDFDAVIEHHNHVCEIHILGLESSRLQQLASTIMQVQFPVLTHLRLGCVPCSPATVLPDGFLGEHVPRLKSLELLYVPFPVL